MLPTGGWGGGREKLPKEKENSKKGRNKTKQNLNALRLGPHSTMKMQTNQK